MDKRIRATNKKGLEKISLGKVIAGLFQGVGQALDFAARMEKEGKSQYEEHGQAQGMTKSGKEYRGSYGIRVKIDELKGRNN